MVPGTEPSDTGPSGSGSGDAGPSSSQPLLLQQAVDKAKGEVSRLTSALTAAEQADVVAREAAAKRDGELAEEAKAEGERAKNCLLYTSRCV